MLENTTKLPEWDLSDLYDKPNSNAFEKDFELLKSLIDEFEKEYKDKILVDVNHIDLASKKIKKSIIAYEKIINLIGKLSAFATLHHVTATNDALRTKFYGDTQARITDIANKIIFYELELNKISDHIYKDLLNTELLIPYKTWFDNVRKYKPHQLTDEIEQIFQEKSITSFSAWNRLFDQTISNMKVNLNGEEKSLEEALNKNIIDSSFESLQDINDKSLVGKVDILIVAVSPRATQVVISELKNLWNTEITITETSSVKNQLNYCWGI